MIVFAAILTIIFRIKGHSFLPCSSLLPLWVTSISQLNSPMYILCQLCIRDLYSKITAISACDKGDLLRSQVLPSSRNQQLKRAFGEVTNILTWVCWSGKLRSWSWSWWGRGPPWGMHYSDPVISLLPHLVSPSLPESKLTQDSIVSQKSLLQLCNVMQWEIS